MATNTAARDPNFVPTIQGVDSATFTLPTNIAVDPNTHAMLVTNNSSPTGTQTVAGGLTNNTAAPTTTNMGVLPALANASQPSWTEGDQVLESVNLKGSQRFVMQDAALNDRGVNVTSSHEALVFVNNNAGGAIMGRVNIFDTNNSNGANVTNAKELQTIAAQKDVFTGPTTFTITLASLATSAVGVGRQSTLVTGNTARSAEIGVKFTVSTTPTANTLIYVYLLRSDGTISDDNAGASDAGITIINAPLLGTILCPAATSNVSYYGVFDTKFLGSLGTSFGIAVVNSTGTVANATTGNFQAEYTIIT